MGRTREQKAAAEASRRRAVEARETRQKATLETNLAGPDKIWGQEQLESMLVLQAFEVVEDGHIAIPFFERIESDLAAIKRAEDVLKRNGVHSLEDLEIHF
jgi:hypothetical protein